MNEEERSYDVISPSTIDVDGEEMDINIRYQEISRDTDTKRTISDIYAEYLKKKKEIDKLNAEMSILTASLGRLRSELCEKILPKKRVEGERFGTWCQVGNEEYYLVVKYELTKLQNKALFFNVIETRDI